MSRLTLFPFKRDQVRTDRAQPTLPEARPSVLPTARRSIGELLEAAPCDTNGGEHVTTYLEPGTAVLSAADASPWIEASAFYEPHVELASIGERVKMWVACGLFCALVWGAIIKAVLL